MTTVAREAFASAEIDALLRDPSFVENPFPAYARLREEFPLFWSDAWGVWVLTRYDDVVGVLRDPERFSNAGRFQRLLDDLPPAVRAEMEPLYHHYTAGLLQEDPPRHTRMRALVRQPFAVKTIASTRPRVERLVGELLDAVSGQERFDLVPTLSYPLPVTVICDMLGVADDDRAQVGQWSDDLSGLQASGSATPEGARIAARAVLEVEAFFRALAAERAREPREDLMSAMVAAREGADTLSEEELLSMAVTFLVAGHETTKNLISSTLLLLLQRPEVLAEVRSEPALAAHTVEEALRFESPVQRAWRIVTEDVELLGQTIRKNELVFLMLGAANRDPDVFPRPDVFDIHRPEKSRNIAFGSGAHFCLGAHLGRLEGEVALSALLERYDDIALDGDVRWNPSIHLHGPTTLPLLVSGRAS